MNVLVTGGAGYIGSHACKTLCTSGYTPICYDNLIIGNSSAVKWGPFEFGDITDLARLSEIIKKHEPEAVMHFAGSAYVGESVTDPQKYYLNNVYGTLQLLEAMRKHKIDKLVFSSSCATYGLPECLPITEEQNQRPINPYGSSKLMVERILKDFDIAYGIRSISLRYFNAAGADIESEIGENHNPETHLIPLAICSALGLNPSITIFGNDYDTQDGTCVRDYIHVSDICSAHILALKSLENGASSNAYNLANGQGFSIKQIIEKVESVGGKKVPITIGKKRVGDPPVLIGNAVKATKALGWSPRFSSIQHIIETAWKWHIKTSRQ